MDFERFEDTAGFVYLDRQRGPKKKQFIQLFSMLIVSLSTVYCILLK